MGKEIPREVLRARSRPAGPTVKLSRFSPAAQSGVSSGFQEVLRRKLVVPFDVFLKNRSRGAEPANGEGVEGFRGLALTCVAPSRMSGCVASRASPAREARGLGLRRPSRVGRACGHVTGVGRWRDVQAFTV